mgnify:CR=1 FL=1
MKSGGTISAVPCAKFTKQMRHCLWAVLIISGSAGEIRTALIFVAVMGAFNYTFAEATYSQSLPDLLGSHARAFSFMGGVPQMMVPDNLKSCVTKACRYDPDMNPAYQQLASHYDVAIVPARLYKDKAKAEVAGKSLSAGYWRACSITPSSRWVN